MAGANGADAGRDRRPIHDRKNRAARVGRRASGDGAGVGGAGRLRGELGGADGKAAATGAIARERKVAVIARRLYARGAGREPSDRIIRSAAAAPRADRVS